MSDFKQLRTYFTGLVRNDATLQALFTTNVVTVYIDQAPEAAPGPYIILSFGPANVVSIIENEPILKTPILIAKVVTSAGGYSALDAIHDRLMELLLAVEGVISGTTYIGKLGLITEAQFTEPINNVTWYSLISTWSITTARA